MGFVVGYAFDTPGCNPNLGSCNMTATVSAEFRGNHQNDPELTGGAYSFAQVDLLNSANAVIATCGLAGSVIEEDFGLATVSSSVSCSNPAAAKYTVNLMACPRCIPCPGDVPPPPCRKTTPVPLDFAGPTAANCPPPPPPSRCPDDESSCSLCTGPMSASSPGGGGPGLGPAKSGPGAQLHYAASGAGFPTRPGAAAWAVTLGRGWSHDHAERIVIDPITGNDSHVWLITKYATFREFSGLSGGVYNTVKPSDEKRKLTRTGSGWELRELNGAVHVFDAAGLWASTTDRNGNAMVATYLAGQLDSVSFADGRSETFGYESSGKLASITEIGVGGSPTRTWSYTWTGDDLTRIERPDGTAYEIFYDDPSFPGFPTRFDLVSTDLVHRVEAAWEYDTFGNVEKTWRGDPLSTGPNAIDLYTFTYTNPALPTEASVVDPLGETTVYTIGRDIASRKPKLTQISGDCPVCGTGPNSVFTYADSSNPLLPTQVIDGRGLRTQHAYNANGQMTSKTEAVMTPLARTTTWQYANPSFPAFPTRIDVPSTSGGSALRTTLLDYTGTGDLETRTIEGAEGGSSFSFDTVSTFNTAGQPLVVNPPGHTTADQTTFTYDPVRGDLIPLTRTEPLTGTTTFGHDGFNRRTSVTDANGVETVTTYENLNRVTSVTQKGATPAGDLLTTHTYNTFGDLFRTTLPRGNVVEYGYDAAGRLKTIERKPNASTPGERTLYTLDAFGHRTKEELQRWNGTAWVTESFSDFVYSSRCHLDKVLHPGGTATEYTYDCDGNLEQVWDANHPRASNPTPTQLYEYDELNRLERVTQPWAGGGSAMTSYEYDVQDHLKKVTDPEGNVTTYTTGDRDLMTSQVSPASGTTTYAHNEHGELTSEIDARGVLTTRTIDPADRVTAVTYPDPVLNITYTYDDPGVSFSKGRLIKITRNAFITNYTYDRFGRVLQDGELTYGYDANGNPASLVYPGGVEAVSTFDFADRPATLLARRAGFPDLPLVTAATYLPFGPLSTLTFGSGLTETHGFTNRYFPSSISLTGLLSWTYATDAVGNILSITDTLNAANNRSYGYRDHQYFLTQGNGPWGARSWTYDKIGNRLTEVRGAVTDTYSYLPAPGGGHTPMLSSIELGGGGTRTYDYGPAGHLEETATGTDVTLFGTNAAGRLASIERAAGYADATFFYDGRDYLSLADPTELPFLDGFENGNTCAWGAAVGQPVPPTCTPPPPQTVQPIYSSEGLLHALTRNIAPQRSHIFYFAGRPVAQRDLTGAAESWKLLTTDHLGTPIAASNTGGSLLFWQGGFEPFGADWSNATAAGMFLRFPGQWQERPWENTGPGAETGLYYNVHRWYQSGIARYVRPDPILLDSGNSNSFLYAAANPLVYIDPLGLKVTPVAPPVAPPVPHPASSPTFCPKPVASSPGISSAPGIGPILWAYVTGLFMARPLGNQSWADVMEPCSCESGDDDDDDREEQCDKQYKQDLGKCRQWFPFGPNRLHRERYIACKGQAAQRYAECLRFGYPISPLSPHRFQY